jgi:hypothetical protein
MLLTNNSDVNHLLSQNYFNARQERWLDFLSDFDFEV